jgi:hypothetical protein
LSAYYDNINTKLSFYDCWKQTNKTNTVQHILPSFNCW